VAGELAEERTPAELPQPFLVDRVVDRTTNVDVVDGGFARFISM